MAEQHQVRRGTTAVIAGQVGAVGEHGYDTDKKTLVVFDGVQAGGFPLAREDARPLEFKQPVRVATTFNISLSGQQTIDGVGTLAGDRVLVKDQTTASQNGIYVVATGAWSRSGDFDADADVVSALIVFVEEGNDGADSGWVLATDGTITLGTTALTFVPFTDVGRGPFKAPVRAATTFNITLSGTQVIDGVSVVAGDRALVKDQTTASQNSIYVVSSGGWSRAADFSTDADVAAGLVVFVEEGTHNADSGWVLATDEPITLGTTALTFAPLTDVGRGAFKAPVRVATTLNITLNGLQTIDGISVVAGDRVLVKDQTTASQNSIYTAASGAWARATDFDTDADITSGIVAAVQEGTANADSLWMLTTDEPITLGTTALTFTEITPNEVNVRAALAALTADPSFNSRKITAVADPTAPQHAATKNYVDGVAVGIDWKKSVRMTTTADITLSGLQTIDGVVGAADDRVLVKDQTTGSENGLYDMKSGAWVRSSDADTDAEVSAGLAAFVEEGTVNADTGWVLTTNDPIVVGTTALTFTQFTGIGELVAGTGLTKTGAVVNAVANADGSIVANADDIQVGVLATDAQHGARGGGTQHADAVAGGADGFMTGADKTKLDGIEAGAALKLKDLPENIRTATPYTVVAADVGKMVIANLGTAITFDLTAAGTLGAGFVAFIKNIGVGILTIDPNAAETIDGNTTVTLAQDEWTLIWTEGSNWRSLGVMAANPNYYFRANRNGVNQTGVVTGTETKVQHDNEVSDPRGDYDPTTNYRYTPTKAGMYRVTASVSFLSLGDGKRMDSRIKKNGSALPSNMQHFMGAVGESSVIAVKDIDMNGTTDFLEHFTFHTHGSDRTIFGGPSQTYFEATRLGAI